MRLAVVFSGSVAKHDSPDCANEDHFVVDVTRQRCCVSDGAGQSYAPALWSGILSNAWMAQDRMLGRRSELAAAIGRFERECDVERMSWSRRAAYGRGTFATLLGVRLRGDRLRAVALGDSLLLVEPPGERPVAFPYDLAEAFDARPELVSTIPDANGVFTRARVKDALRSWRVRPGTRIMLMTDALGRWLLTRDADDYARGRLADIRTHEQLTGFVRCLQDLGTLKVDDCTLVHLIVEDA